MRKPIVAILIAIAPTLLALSQPCTPLGDELSFGSANVWIGYAYDNADLSNYRGFVNEGNVLSANFDESFGGDDVTYITNGCSLFTSTFSMRYKLRKTFAAGTYDFTVGGDDGYRLSLDGGSTWVIDRWVDQGYFATTYSVTLSGSYDMVLEYYENGGGNRISFAVAPGCSGVENTAIYGSDDTWNGYIYDGVNFGSYKGMVNEGSPGNISFDQSFGGANVNYPTSGCAVQTETFSVRYRLRKTFALGGYTFIVGADDGYRLSFDGGATWPIDRWADQSYTSSSYTGTLNGTYDMVLEYYENGGDNRVSFTVQSNIILKIDLLSFAAARANGNVKLNWTVAPDSDPVLFDIQRSEDGISFLTVGSVAGNVGANIPGGVAFDFIDNDASDGRAYYRLKMTDAAGITTYSNVISLAGLSTQSITTIFYPTIVQGGRIYVRSDRSIARATVQVTDLAGRLIQRTELTSVDARQPRAIIFANGMPRGCYLITLFAGGERVSTQQFLVP